MEGLWWLQLFTFLPQFFFWVIEDLPRLAFCLFPVPDVEKDACDDSRRFLGFNTSTRFSLNDKPLLRWSPLTELLIKAAKDFILWLVGWRTTLEEIVQKYSELRTKARSSTNLPSYGRTKYGLGYKSRLLGTLLYDLRITMKYGFGYKPPSLETLPYELRMKILRGIPELSDLMSLVGASPVFLHQYVETRKSLLAGILKLSLNGALVDALAVHEAAALRGDESIKRAEVQQHLNRYEVRRKGDGSTIDKLIDKYDERFLRDIYRFYRMYARPLSLKCALFFLSRLDPQRPPTITNLSATENIRLLRALYRFELYSCLFGGESRFNQLGFTEEEVLYFFFCLFRPWEVEEIFSVYTLIHEETGNCLRAMEKKLFHAVTDELTLIGGAASCGLRGFDMALTNTNFHSIITVRSDSSQTSGYGFMENILALDVQAKRRRLFAPTVDDLTEQNGDPLPYVGEAEDQPNAGWVLVCKGYYINAYGGSAHEPSPRHWGYVFWDRWRLTKMKGDRKLKSLLWQPGVTQ